MRNTSRFMVGTGAFLFVGALVVTILALSETHLRN